MKFRKLGKTAQTFLANKKVQVPGNLEIRGNLILPSKKIII